MRVTVLGCGSSSGVPTIGCNCAVCRSGNPKNKRSRVSILIESNGLKLLVDTSPDLHQQALANRLNHLDAVLFTHDHADHVHGIDELRSFNYLANAPLPIYGDKNTLQRLQERFAYAFLPRPEQAWFRPCLIPHVLADEPCHAFTIGACRITAFEQRHGKGKTLGYRIGDFAYSTDANELPESAFAALTGVKIWIVDCLRYTQSPSHANLEQTLQWVARVKPRQAILTHMSHDFDYDMLAKTLPSHVVPGYDGMVIEL